MRLHERLQGNTLRCAGHLGSGQAQLRGGNIIFILRIIPGVIKGDLRERGVIIIHKGANGLYYIILICSQAQGIIANIQEGAAVVA